MNSLRKLILVVILGLATICAATGAVLYWSDAPVLVANDPLPPPPIPWVV
ncbi:MAG TPA: hypothetical protein VIH17_02705 [Candidatus Acidoferrales bacterium]